MILLVSVGVGLKADIHRFRDQVELYLGGVANNDLPSNNEQTVQKLFQVAPRHGTGHNMTGKRLASGVSICMPSQPHTPPCHSALAGDQPEEWQEGDLARE